MARMHVARFAAAAAVTWAVALPMIAWQGQAFAAGASSRPALTLTVTSVTPAYATPGQTLILRGRIKNNSANKLSGLSLQLLSSDVPFSNETTLKQFTQGTYQAGGPVSGVSPLNIRHLGGKQSVGWRLKLPVNDLGLSCFGVYPLTVTASNAASTATGSLPVPLPFWPGKADSCPDLERPAPFRISWVWPLIDTPAQGPCPGLLSNSLAASVAPGGRLADLLAIGSQYSAQAHLTWAIDPALLDNVKTMTTPYDVGTSAGCQGSSSHAADPDARTWLSGVAHATAGQPVFVTPYADVDLAGLAQYSNVPDLHNAFTDGEQLAAPLLGRKPVPVQLPAGPKLLSAVAWPADGLANPALLEILGAMHVGTVILAMPRSSLDYTPGAVTSVNDGVGTKLKVLLADDSLSGLLGSKAASSRQAGSIFSVSQMFLAETAMIVAEAPAMQRPILVAPPRRWDPTGTLAGDLLGDTVTAPWLRPSTLGELARQPADAGHSRIVQPKAGEELPRGLLRQVTSLDRRVNLIESIMATSDPRLSRAVYGIESSRWVGQGVGQSRALLSRTSRFVSGQFASLSIGGRQAIKVTLGGRNGSVTGSIHNDLSYTIRVGLRIRSSNDTVSAKQKSFHAIYVVQPHSSTPFKLSVNATQTGKATLRLRLTSATGALLPVEPLTMNISVTNLGTVALVICAAALAIFVSASAAQAIRRGRPRPPDEPSDEPSDGPSGGQEGDESPAPAHDAELTKEGS
ncbi:MAG TPA: DUF6049 family protein [Streptosporangiaceae bacterium]|nr:DUF6049 family protein [Streptosporangiaceae bacterium]